ncbi:MAG TPA: hypothetical protein V6D10_20680 [Trichocoleus sp.]|jgi:hypothetical protein
MNDKLMAELLLEIKELKSLIKTMSHQSFHQSAPPSDEEWAIGSAAWSAFKAEGVRSASHLKRLRQEGVFSEGRGEIRNVSSGQRPTWEYNIPRCKVALKHYFDRLSA